MAPEAQTIFSVTLFLALSSLLAWTTRRHRAAHSLNGSAAGTEAADVAASRKR